MQRQHLQKLSREELVREAERAGVPRPRVLTQAELIDEILKRTAASDRDRARARGWLGRARDLLANVVEKGLHLPDAAAAIRQGPKGWPPPPPPPLPTVTLAEIYAAQGHLERAVAVLDDVLRREPEHEEARELRARFLAQLEREGGGEAASPGAERAAAGNEEEEEPRVSPPAQGAVEAPGAGTTEGATAAPPQAATEEPGEAGAPARRPAAKAAPGQEAAPAGTNAEPIAPVVPAAAPVAPGAPVSVPPTMPAVEAREPAESMAEIPAAPGVEAGGARAPIAPDEATAGGEQPSGPSSVATTSRSPSAWPAAEAAAGIEILAPAEIAVRPPEAVAAPVAPAAARSSAQGEPPAPAREVAPQPSEPAVDAALADTVPAEAAPVEAGAAGEGAPSALPARYDVDEVVAIAVDPSTFYVYWEVRPTTFAHAAAQAPGGWLALRVTAVTPGWDGPIVETRDIRIDALFGDRFVHHVRPRADVRVSVGWLAEGRFDPIAVGAEVSAPRAFVAAGAPAPAGAPLDLSEGPHGAPPVVAFGQRPAERFLAAPALAGRAALEQLAAGAAPEAGAWGQGAPPAGRDRSRWSGALRGGPSGFEVTFGPSRAPADHGGHGEEAQRVQGEGAFWYAWTEGGEADGSWWSTWTETWTEGDEVSGASEGTWWRTTFEAGTWGGASEGGRWGGASEGGRWGGGSERRMRWGGASERRRWGGASEGGRWGGASERGVRWGGASERSPLGGVGVLPGR